MNERSIFMEALDLDEPGEREAHLLRACGDDGRLRARVEALLRRHQEADGFVLDRVPEVDLAATVEMAPPLEEPGTTIGPYRLMEQIGEGGMGVVYVAEQSTPVRRRVALKVIKPGMDTRQVIARFEAERQALAMMDHPNIARVFDAGATDSGRPFFVMELVRGLPMTDYCDQHQLSIPERLELFVLVCRAVQHAHQKGIIHRDLKPSNVLVTVIDGAAVPKVIDFGIAKATGAALTDGTLYTGFHQLVGTPHYMSPEQAELSGVDVDIRSDIYSLGVLLYELLTGTTPIDAETFRKSALDELRRLLREQEPPTPSARLSTLIEPRRSSISVARHAEARRLNRSVRGELDWIVMKALEKDRRRRYETASALAADVMRHLTDQPVEAGPPSAWYRFGKFARRHRAALTTGMLVALALIVGTGVTLWQAARTRQAATEARLRAEESRQVIDYLVTDVFGATTPGKGRDRSVTVGELLDRADATVGERFRGQPLVEASVRMALLRSYSSLWDQARAEPHAIRVVDLRTRHLGPEHPETLEAMYQHASVLCDAGWRDPDRWEEAVAIARRVLAARRRVLGPTHPETLGTQSFLAYLLLRLDRLDEALVQVEQAHVLALRTLGPEHLMTLGTCDALGQIVAARGDPGRGEALVRRVAEGRQRALGPLHPATIGALHNLANLLNQGGRLDDARELYFEIVARNWRVFGPCHVSSSSAMGGLFEVLGRQNDTITIRDTCQHWLRDILATPPEADPYLRYRRSVRLSGLAFRLVMLPDPIPFDADLVIRAAEAAVDLHDDWDDAWTCLAVVYYRLGRLDDAMRAIQASMARPRWEGGDDFDWLVLALIHARRGEMAQARQWYDKARNRPDPVDFHRDDLKPLRDEAEALLGESEEPRPGSGEPPSEPTTEPD